MDADERSNPMSRHIQVTFDAHDSRALSFFWREVLGYVHPGPPGVDLPEDADPLAAWDDFLAQVGVPEDQRNTRSAIEDPDGHGPRLFFQQVPEPKTTKNRVHVDLLADDREKEIAMLAETRVAPCHGRWEGPHQLAPEVVGRADRVRSWSRSPGVEETGGWCSSGG